jgi:hypothetical protein
MASGVRRRPSPPPPLKVPAVRTAAPRTAGSGAHGLLFPQQAARVFEAVRRVALQPDLACAAHEARSGMADLTGSERVHCLFRDPGTGVLWSLEEIADAPVPRPADHAGITTFAARTGAPVAAERAADSPLYRPELDDPDGDGSERLIAQPVFSGSAVIAVIAAVRPASAPPYSPAERLAVAAFAEHGGPILQHFLLDHRLRHHDEVAPPPDAAPWAGAPAPVGVESHGEAAPQAVRLSQPWMQWSYQLLLAVVGAGLLFAAIARVPIYSAGPAMVRIEGSGGDLSAVALLPASDRPRLAAGMAVGLELAGKPGKLRGVLEEVGGEVIGAREARGLLGTAHAIGEPVIMVRVRLTGLTGPMLDALGRAHGERSGARAVAEVKVGSRRLLAALIPGGQ